ncbi:MAG: hypothetical protein Q4D98_09225 [Planctomycetia bacterium]|nr:hypothetical protein [Planctomycetia bacterium]
MARVYRQSRWVLLRWTLFLFIAAVVVVVCLVLNQLDAIIYRKTKEVLREKFLAADAVVANAHLLEGEGIELARFVLFARHEESDTKEKFPAVLEAERVLLKCPTRLDRLAAKELPISKMVFDSATIRTYRRPDRTWSLGALKMNPAQASKGPSPVIQFRNTTIELWDMTDTQQERRLVLYNVEMTIDTAALTTADASGNRVEETKYLPFSGTADCEYSRDIAFYGRFYPERGEIRVEVDVDTMKFSSDLVDRIPVEIAERLDGLRTLRGDVTTHVTVAAPLDDFSEARFFLDGKLTDGRAEDPRLPQAVSNISTDFRIGNDGFVFSNLKTKYGEGATQVSFTQWGYGVSAPRRIEAKISKLHLTDGVTSAMPDSVRNFLEKIRPTGQVDMDAVFHYDGSHWKTSGKIHCTNASIQYEYFPYRVDKLDGDIQLNGDAIQFTMKSNDGAIALDGDFQLASKASPEVPAGGKVRIRGVAIPVEERLIAACPEKARDFLRSLEVSGAVNIFSDQRFTLSNRPDVPVQRDSRITVQLLKNACRYRNFPYPLRDVQGTIDIVNDHLTAQNLRGRNGQAEVVLSCESKIGEVTTVPAQNPLARPALADAYPVPELTLSIRARNVHLDDDFYAKLPPSVQQLHQYVRAQGTVNITYDYRKKPDIPEHLSVRMDTPAQGIVLMFPEIPYQFEKFKGSFLYENGVFRLDNFSAEHGLSKIAGRLDGKITSPGVWDCDLTHLTVDSVRFDRELLSLLPNNLRTSVAARRPDGFLHYRGDLGFHYNLARKQPLAMDWNGEIGLSQASFDFGIRLTNITGGVLTQGSWMEGQFQSRGELNLDSLFYQNAQFTNVRGPLWVDNRQVVLGENAAKQAANRRALSAQAVGGNVFGNFVLTFGEPSTFRLHAVVTAGKLEECVYLTGNDRLKGDVAGILDLQGTESSLYSLRGKGEIHLTNADIYQLSVMMSLLKILSLKEVNQKGFSSGDVQFRIDGNHVYFDQLNFYGDAFSLFGKGEMNFKQQVQLLFYSVMGRGETNIPIISPLLHATGRQMMMIVMHGPIQNPEITQTPLPGLNMALQQMEQDFQTPPTRTSSQPGMLR